MIVAIDGPAASGKGTIAKLLAEKLNLETIDTGRSGSLHRIHPVFLRFWAQDE